MSKVDAQRAMREANYARNRASGPTRREEAAAAGNAPAPTPAPAADPPGAKPARAAKVAKAAKAAPVAAAPEAEPCGHKSMNGRACTREAGHSEKSHRYG